LVLVGLSRISLLAKAYSLLLIGHSSGGHYKSCKAYPCSVALFDAAWVAIIRLKLKSQKYFAVPRVLAILSKEVENVSIIYLCQNI